MANPFRSHGHEEITAQELHEADHPPRRSARRTRGSCLSVENSLSAGASLLCGLTPMSPADAIRGLRELALSMRPDQLDLAENLARRAAYGIVMDMALEEAVVTLTSFISGDASLYFSTGGGVLGGGGQAAVSEAAKAFVRLSSSCLDRAVPAPDHAVPPVGRVFFYLLTLEGVHRAEASYEDLTAGQGPLAALFAAGQEVIAQFRKIQEAGLKPR